nr:hypothetical protein FJN17_12170 [Bradyrhizobium symbiodeficiens]
MRVVAILALSLSLGGCITDDWAAERIARDDQKCQSYGARPGSDAYVNCRAQLDSARTTANAIDSAAAPVPIPTSDAPKLPPPVIPCAPAYRGRC